MPTFLEIAVNVPRVSGVFHYHLPAELEGRIAPGHLVEVPFAHQTVQGVVLNMVAEPAVPETRPVLSLVDAETVVTQAQIALARQLAEDTLASLAECVSLMLPPGLSQQADTLYQLRDPGRIQRQAYPKLSPLQTRLIHLLQERGPLRGRQIDQVIPRLDWRNTARGLVKSGWIITQPVLPTPSTRPKTARTARLACSPEVAEQAMDHLGARKSPAIQRRQAMLRFFLREPGPVEVAWLYAESGGTLTDLRYLAGKGLVTLGEAEVWRDPLADLAFTLTEPPVLTQDQQAAWSEIRSVLHGAVAGKSSPPFLLHGVTGSGKTEIYLHAVEETLQLGKQAIVLVPEIAMTPQAVQRFVGRFPGRVGLIHSRLSSGERYDTWRRARHGDISVIVGPRSALFTPFKQIGLIVVDECHDDSYFQADIPPHYHAREAAVTYAHLVGAVCLLGSATPDIISRYRAETGQWRYLSLPDRILAHRQAIQKQLQKLADIGDQAAPGGLPVFHSHYRPLEEQAETIDLPPVRVVDMRQELKAGNRSIFSRSLQAALGQVLETGQQAILFLNRRGMSTHVFCRDCGYVLKCPHCDIPLTYHSDQAAVPNPQKPYSGLLCHRCGYQRHFPQTCPQCGSTRIRQYGTGTERVETEVHSLFPGAHTLRWDFDTTRQKGAHEAILSHFSNHQADILIGTQMIAKGLDLPLVTLVGVILADVGLNLPDLRAAERTFQVLTQVAGRAGRSPLGGSVILQTFQPDHYVIQAAAQHDYQAFYRQELSQRLALGYPPFTRLVRLEYRHTDPLKAETAARSMANQLHTWLEFENRAATELIGPAPCFFTRASGLYRWQVILRGPDPVSLLRGRSIAEWHIEVDPPSLL